MKFLKAFINEIREYKDLHRALGAFVCCLLIIGLCIVSFSADIDKLVEKNYSLLTENDDLKYKLDNLHGDYDRLHQEFESVSAQYDDIQKEIQNYKDQQATIDDLNAQLSDLQKQYNNLSKENETLQAQLDSVSSNGSANGWRLPIPGSSGYSSASSSSDTVWIPEDGEKYHSIPDCGRMNPNTATQTTRSSAEAMGYDACSKCW